MLEYTHINNINNRFCYKLINTSDFYLIKEWSQKFTLISYLSSNNYYTKHKSAYSHNKYDFLLALNYNNSSKNHINSLSELKKTQARQKDWLFGYFSYDLKNEIHNTSTNKKDKIGFGDLFFFNPDIVFYSKENQVYVESKEKINLIEFKKEINSDSTTINTDFKISFKAKYSKNEYLQVVNMIKQDIQLGEIYELNFCQEFYNNSCYIDSWSVFKKLSSVSPTPFSAFFKQQESFLISASPERFLLKNNRDVISQPIKGTIRKSKNNQDNSKLEKELRTNPKEQSENVMIVDLVRNDLSKTAIKSSVKVDELFGIYPFKQLYQMISTVSSVLKSKVDNTELIESCFPMGSMTGAPKIRAMELIEQYEKSKRGLYSGSVGYFAPNGDFDFNVVIRSLLYNSDTKYLSYTVGSAITIQSDPLKEYEECFLKAKAINDSLS